MPDARRCPGCNGPMGINDWNQCQNCRDNALSVAMRRLEASVASAEERVAAEEKRISDEIMEAQADLQVGLGLFRLGCAPGHTVPDEYIEERLAKSLARLHALLGSLGRPMYQPAQHPDIELERWRNSEEARPG